MDTRFTIEEENIVVIPTPRTAGETTLENILAAMPMDEDMRQLAAAAVNKLQAHDGQRVFRREFYLDRQRRIPAFASWSPIIFIQFGFPVV